MFHDALFRRRIVFFSSLSFLMVFLLLMPIHQTQGQGTARQGWERQEELSVGQSRRGQILRSKPQVYPIRLEAGQYLKVVAGQEAIDIGLQLLDARETQIADVNRDTRGTILEELETVVENSGEYFLVVIAMESRPERIPYELQMLELRPSTPREQQLARAERKQCESWSLRRSGKPNAAITPALEALQLRKEILTEARNEQYDYADVLSHLGNAYREMGDFINAHPALEEASKVWGKILAPDHSSRATALSNLGLNYSELGDFDRAEALLRESLTIREQRVGPKSTELLATLNNLASVYWAKKDFRQAETYFRRTVEIFEAANVVTLYMAAVYSNLSAVLIAEDKIAEAETALKRSLEIYDTLKFDAFHPDRGLTYATMASCSFKKGDYTEAEVRALKGLEILERSFSPEHPRIIESLNNLSMIYRAMGNTEQALNVRERACELREKNLRRNLTLGSENQKTAMLKALAAETNDTISMHAQFAKEEPRALRLALTTWLRRKGRALDEMNQTVGSLQHLAETEADVFFQQWKSKRDAYARLAVGGTGEKTFAALNALNEEIEKLEAELSRRSLQFRAQSETVRIEDVQAALPQDSVLVEFAHYLPVDAKTKKALDARYLAYVLPKQGVAQWIDLGDAARINAAVLLFRREMSNKTQSTSLRSITQQLNELVMKPIRPLLGQTKTVFVSPDGELNRLPFATLRDERGRYLIEDYLFVYLTSGRDLLRLQIKHESRPEQVIFAVSDFDDSKATSAAEAKSSGVVSDARSGLLSADATMATLKFPRLEYVRAEGEAVRRLFPQAKLFADGQALETALKQVRRPYFLHLATHGFFLSDSDQQRENPLLRSGLAFAGANLRRSGDDDGLLTAYEAAALDLWGTKLVVLSACETGNGEVKNGEGVFGLRRALVLAGAETQVTSLWRADDLVTRKLMQQFYTNLHAGLGRAEALRQAQLKLLRSRATPSPYFWANFISIGEWKPLGQ